MIRLLLYRVAPLGAAIAIFSSALSPLRPALEAFARAASALAGETAAGGVALQPPALTASTRPSQASPRGKTLQQLAEQLRGEEASTADDADDPFGEKAGARAPTPLARPHD